MKNYFRILSVLVASTLLSCAACSKDDDATSSPTITIINPGSDPNFKIVENTDTGFTGFNRKVEVFDIPIYAVTAVEDVKLLHAANLMAQYLDNDEDGVIDNQAVVEAMKNNNAFLFLWKNESDLETLESLRMQKARI